MKDRWSALLWPREHGAYGELLFPLASSLLLGRPGVVAWGLCSLALGGFLAHEGLVVLAGRRGIRARRDDGSRARMSLMCFGAVALIGGLTALSGSDHHTAWAAAGALLLACVAIAFAWLGAERSLAGELMAAMALTAWATPVALASGLPTTSAIGVWLTWFAVFALGTTAVESVMARTARRSPRPAQLLGVTMALLSLGSALGAARQGLLPTGAALIVSPAVLVSMALIAAPIPARHLRSIGWSMIIVSVVTLLLMLRLFERAP